MKTLEQIRAELKAAVESDRSNVDELLGLVSELAQQDPDKIRFSVDAGLINRLGLQLVARQETAVAELIKNAFDADATQVKLIFSGSEGRSGGRLIVEDNGEGMTKEQLVNGFMRLASDEKIREPTSPRFKRQRAGRKGIGRFAAQRLGESMTLVTQTRAGADALEVGIDWRRFDVGGDLFTVSHSIRATPKKKSHGTTLIIDDLRESWSDAQIRRVYRYVEDLQQPFPLDEPIASNSKDPGFKARFFRATGVRLLPIADEEKMLFDHALAEVRGEVDAEGKAKWSVNSKRLKLDDSEDLSADANKLGQTFAVLRNVRFQAHYFIWKTDYVPGQELSRLQDLAEEKGGIRLYRNGFRVSPYGEPDDDWLDLDREYSRRGVLVPVKNSNWFGFVEVWDPVDKFFQETSSREGLLQTAAFRELVSFVRNSLIAAAKRIGTVRGKKVKAGDRRRQTPPNERLNQVADDLEKAARLIDRGKSTQLYSAAVFRQTAEVVRQAATESEELLGELTLLRILASVGQAIGIFTHEVRHRLVDMEANAQNATTSLDANHPAYVAIASFVDHVKLLRAYTAYFDSTISASVQRARVPQNLSFILHDFIRDFEPIAARSAITFADPDIQEHVLWTRPMHQSEWASVLMNLFTNSVKAIRRGPNRGHGRIFIRAWQEDESVFVDFADNGDGVPVENTERIFNAFFTTTGGPNEANSEIGGSGLGLKIVQDILSAADGSIELTGAPEGYATAFRIEVPAGEDQ
jgi:signal transduction histidine kinase